MTRTIQTACHAFEKETTPLLAWSIVMESYPYLPECQGSPVEALKDSALLKAMKRFEDVDLSGVEPNWWETSGDTYGRIATFIKWLESCPQSRIAVVCHWGFIYSLMRSVKAPISLSLHNCTHVRTRWGPNREDPLCQREYCVYIHPAFECTLSEECAALRTLEWDLTATEGFAQPLFSARLTRPVRADTVPVSFIKQEFHTIAESIRQQSSGSAWHIASAERLSVIKTDDLFGVGIVSDALANVVDHLCTVPPFNRSKTIDEVVFTVLHISKVSCLWYMLFAHIRPCSLLSIGMGRSPSTPTPMPSMTYLSCQKFSIHTCQYPKK